ncbi:signal-transducing adaptor protein 2b isoform X1 [Misgurnus anguillicaudatus]|uniref:signal-transducing adaptor protein 2b isoform X1 n=1 Tax=Misgurnus anguillicaudatus TaxID=75329 RepID=UPI003CCF85E0
MATPRRPAGRARCQLPACYHEGFLEKKSSQDKMGRKLWTSLCGNSLFFFNNTKDNAYIDKLDVSDLISVSDDYCRDRNLGAARFTLHMKNEEIVMIAPTLEARELWKGYLLSVAKLTVPSSLNLLPGQIHIMKEIIEKEKKRQRSNSSPESNIYVSVISDMPACFYKVSRVEAELRLEQYPEYGNLLLRPRQDGASFAITTREDVNGRSIFKHYRVTRRQDGGFYIDIETPISCNTLHDVVNCMVEKTNSVLKPFVMEEYYEDTITFVETNEENGELTFQEAINVPSHSPPAPPPKPGKRNHKAYSDTSSNIYVNEQDDSEIDEVDDFCPGPPVTPRVPARLPHQNSLPVLNPNSACIRKALKPPGYPNHVPRSQSLSDLTENFESSQNRQKPAGITKELELLFRRRAMRNDSQTDEQSL